MRDPRNGRFVAGFSGNPGGRPSRKPLTALLATELDKSVGSGETTAAELIVQKVLDRARAGDPWACQLVFDRIEGKALASLSAHVSSSVEDYSEGAYERLVAKLSRYLPQADANATPDV